MRQTTAYYSVRHLDRQFHFVLAVIAGHRISTRLHSVYMNMIPINVDWLLMFF